MAIDEVIHDPTGHIVQPVIEEEFFEEDGTEGNPILLSAHLCVHSSLRTRSAEHSNQHYGLTLCLHHAEDSDGGDVVDPIKTALERLFRQNEQPFRNRVLQHLIKEEYNAVGQHFNGAYRQ